MPKFVKVLVLLLVLLAGCGGGGGDSDAPQSSIPAEPAWTLQFSTNMPAHPTAVGDGFYIDLPHPDEAAGSVHYVTRATGSLSGMRGIRIGVRVEADPGVRIQPREYPQNPATLTAYFQRRGDGLTASFEAYRWYSATRLHLVPGDHVLDVPFDGAWGAVLRSTRENNLAAFNEALEQAERVGFVLGGGDGAGHGIYATGPARITVTSFTLQ